MSKYSKAEKIECFQELNMHIGNLSCTSYKVGSCTKILTSDMQEIDLYKTDIHLTCEKCNKEYTSKKYRILKRKKKGKLCLCKSCTDEQRAEAQCITKTINGTRPRDKIARGEMWGICGIDQSKGSEVREKMNKTKTENGTQGFRGSETHKKFINTKMSNGTHPSVYKTGFNKLNGIERSAWLHTTRPGFMKWTYEQRVDHNRRVAKSLRRGGRDPRPPRDPNYIKYLKICAKLTNLNYKGIENWELRSVDFHVDHIISKKFGYDNNIPPFIICNRYNLRILTRSENSSKQERCDMDIEDLFLLIYSENSTVSSLKMVNCWKPLRDI